MYEILQEATRPVGALIGYAPGLTVKAKNPYTGAYLTLHDGDGGPSLGTETVTDPLGRLEGSGDGVWVEVLDYDLEYRQGATLVHVQRIRGGEARLAELESRSLKLHYGGVGDGVADDTAAVTAALADLADGTIRALHVDGQFRVTGPLVLDLAAVSTEGCLIYGDGVGSKIIFEGVTVGDCFLVRAGVGVGAFYFKMRDVAVTGRTAGSVLKVGRDDFSDPFNQCVISGVSVQNSGSGRGATLNFLVTSDIDGSFVAAADTGPDGGGIYGLVCRQCVLNRFFVSCSAGETGGTALYITGGANYGNTFGTLDVENAHRGIRIDGALCFYNTFVGPVFATTVGVDAQAGNRNKFIHPFFGGQVTQRFEANFGIQFDSSHGIQVLQPSVDPSAGDIVLGTLTGNYNVAAPVNPQPGQQLHYVFTQDATGGRIVTFDAVFKLRSNAPFPDETAGGAVSAISFSFDGTSWQETARRDGAFDQTGTALPGPSAAYRGRLFRVRGGAGVADSLHICEKNAANGYVWRAI